MMISKMAAIGCCMAGAAFLFSAGCGDDELSSPGTGSVGTGAGAYTADTAVRWFDQLRTAIKTESTNPPRASRLIGYTTVAAYESCVPGMSMNNSLGGQLNEMPTMPAATGTIHYPAAVNAAVATVLRGFFASATQPTLDGINALETTLTGEYDDTVAASTLANSDTFGDAVGNAILAWAAADGAAEAIAGTYTVPVGAGVWAPTPPAFGANPLLPHWGEVRPMVMLHGSEIPFVQPPAYSETMGSQYYIEALEVQTTKTNLTAEQMAIADFWNDGAGAPGTPPAHWLSIVNQVATTNTYKLDKTVEAAARCGAALMDAFIACWRVKYITNGMRPVTYIRSATGLNDPTWTSYIGTPAFPTYTSGHSTQSGAASQALTDMLGTIAFNDNTHGPRNPPLPARSFTSFFAAAEEAAVSRLYGGIHYRSDNNNGFEHGRTIGSLVDSRIMWKK